LPRVVRKELAWPEPALDARRAARVLPDGRCVETETRLAFAGIAHRVGEAREREEKHELLGRDAGDLEERSRLDGVMLDRGAALEERVWKLREGRAIREGLGVHVDLRDDGAIGRGRRGRERGARVREDLREPGAAEGEVGVGEREERGGRGGERR